LMNGDAPRLGNVAASGVDRVALPTSGSY